MPDDTSMSAYMPPDANKRADIDTQYVADMEAEQTSDVLEHDPHKHTYHVNLTFTEWIRARFFGADLEQELQDRLRNLDHAIEQHRKAPSNYLLRGELFIKLQDYVSANDDLKRAVELAEAEFTTSDWGVLSQSVRDQALKLLEEVERYH